MADVRPLNLLLAFVMAGCATPSLPDEFPSPDAAMAGSNATINMNVAIARLEAGNIQEERRILSKMGPERWLRGKYCDGLGGEPVPFEGTVLAADDDTGIHLISFGSKNGVKLGDAMVAHREDEVLGLLVIDKVFNDKSSAVFQRIDGKPMKKAALRVGDRIASAY